MAKKKKVAPRRQARAAGLPTLSRDGIRAELAKMWGAAHVADKENIGNYIAGGPGAVAAFWEPLDEWPPFNARGLRLGPSDLRFVTTVGEMVDVVAWGLKRAK